MTWEPTHDLKSIFYMRTVNQHLRNWGSYPEYFLSEVKYCQCDTCKEWFTEAGIQQLENRFNKNRCYYCFTDKYFTEAARGNIYNHTRVERYKHPQWLVELIAIYLKTRWVLLQKNDNWKTQSWFKFKIKTTKMITSVTNSAEMREALNENLYGLLTGKRKPLVVKEVNNTLGKMLSDVKMEMMQNALSGSRATISWYDRNINSTKRLPAANGKALKTA